MDREFDLAAPGRMAWRAADDVTLRPVSQGFPAGRPEVPEEVVQVLKRRDPTFGSADDFKDARHGILREGSRKKSRPAGP